MEHNNSGGDLKKTKKKNSQDQQKVKS